MRAAARAATVVAALVAVQTAGAQPKLLVNTSSSGLDFADELQFGGALWQHTTSMLNSMYGGGLGTMTSLNDLSAMMQYDALWVDQRFGAAPSATELLNIGTFAASGRRVVIIGENARWGSWNSVLLGMMGGTEGPLLSTAEVGPGCAYGSAITTMDHALTTGVRTISMGCAGYAIGGTSLFDYGVVTLWGKQQNVLAVLDANVFDDYFGPTGDGFRFAQNVADWTAEPYKPNDTPITENPEPASLALVGTGVLALGVAVRRRRRS